MSTATSQMRSRPLTLIVATTPTWGIGFKNSLPWPSLKLEMAYFARVTKRVPSSQTQEQTQVFGSSGSSSGMQNAVIMGRNTYESIPAKFRPLKDRLNIVLTRSPEKLHPGKTTEGPLVAGSMAEALRLLDERRQSVGRVFVIGGSEVYAQAMGMEECGRVLRTRIEREFECDVHFPVDLEKEEDWRRVEQEGLCEFAGEDVPAGYVEQDGVRWEYQMWERGRE